MAQAAVQSNELVISGKKSWVRIPIRGFEAKLTDGTHVKMPSYSIEVATRYPTLADGSLAADMTQARVAEFLRAYNQGHELTGKRAFRYLVLFEDEAVRDRLGKEHSMFDENFERKGQPWRRGYVADFTRSHPALKPVEGISGQTLVHRTAYWRTPYGDVELGPVTIAPDGLVPQLTKKQLEKLVHATGLKQLEKLRGRTIDEGSNKVVDVRNALGYAQFTLSHDYEIDGKLISHSHHVFTPSQEQSEAVGVRGASWLRHGEHRCFCVFLLVGPSVSDPDRSFPLVRGGGIEATRRLDVRVSL